MTPSFFIKLFAIVSVVLGVIVSISAMTSVEVVQIGFSGVGMEIPYKDHMLEEDYAQKEAVPPPLPMASGEGLKAGEAYENVQVLGNLSTGQFTRLMTHITQWVAPEQGCNYCHYAENLASDGKYTKVVSRRMIQMTQHLNENWGSHVQNAGVNCWTCHRGMNVPQYIWFDEPDHPMKDRALGNPGMQNMPSARVGLTSLPSNVFETFLEEDYNIRVVGPTALPTGNRSSIKQTEWTYGLMMHMSNSLGVNCTYCHNSRSVAEWGQSPPARATAWYGIRMVRDLNNNYLNPLQPVYPEHRLGPTGDAPKANCTTCHQGVYKPLLGMNMVEDYPSLKKYVPYQPAQDPEGMGDVEAAEEDADAADEEPAEADDESADAGESDDDAEEAAEAASEDTGDDAEGAAAGVSNDAQEADADAMDEDDATEASADANAGNAAAASSGAAAAAGAAESDTATEAEAAAPAPAAGRTPGSGTETGTETGTEAATDSDSQPTTETGTEAEEG